MLRELWWRILYLLVWPSVQRRGDPIDGDVLIVPSFGRRMMSDQEVFTVQNLLAEHEHYDFSVIMRLHNQPTWFSPGPQNNDLAFNLMCAVKDYDLPVIAQWEVVAALPIVYYRLHQPRIVTLWPKADRDASLTLYDVLVQAKKYCDRYGYKCPVLLVHRRVALRAMFIWLKLTGEFPILCPSYIESFDPESSQPHTRSPWAWILHEAYERWIRQSSKD